VERLNATLLQYLRLVTEGRPTDWPHFIAACAYTYNTAHQTSLGTSPYMLMYGRPPADAVDQWIDEALGVHTAPLQPEEWHFRLNTARYYAQEHLRKTQERNAARLDKHRHDPQEIKKGDFVHFNPILFDVRHHKLSWKGKHVIMRVVSINGNQAVLENPTDPQHTQIANVGDLTVLPSDTPYVDILLYEALHDFMRQPRRSVLRSPWAPTANPVAPDSAPNDKGKEELYDSPRSESPTPESQWSPPPADPIFPASNLRSDRPTQPDVPADKELGLVPTVTIPPLASAPPTRTPQPTPMLQPNTLTPIPLAPLPTTRTEPLSNLRANRIINGTKPNNSRWLVQAGFQGRPDSEAEWRWLDEMTELDRVALFEKWRARAGQTRTALSKVPKQIRRRPDPTSVAVFQPGITTPRAATAAPVDPPPAQKVIIRQRRPRNVTTGSEVDHIVTQYDDLSVAERVRRTTRQKKGAALSKNPPPKPVAPRKP
jgi:hypothetical protein